MDSAQYEQMIRDLNAQLGGQMTDAGPTKAIEIARQRLNEAYGYNKPLIEEAAAAEAAAYNMPGQLLNQYTGIGNPMFTSRMQSNLSDMANALERANVARGLLNTRMGYLGDIANSIGGQYSDYLAGLQNQISNLTPLYQSRLQAEENARNRASSIDNMSWVWDVLEQAGLLGNNTTAQTNTATGQTASPTSTGSLGSQYNPQFQTLLQGGNVRNSTPNSRTMNNALQFNNLMRGL